jgi:hypothetical protein
MMMMVIAFRGHKQMLMAVEMVPLSEGTVLGSVWKIMASGCTLSSRQQGTRN